MAAAVPSERASGGGYPFAGFVALRFAASPLRLAAPSFDSLRRFEPSPWDFCPFLL